MVGNGRPRPRDRRRRCVDHHPQSADRSRSRFGRGRTTSDPDRSPSGRSPTTSDPGHAGPKRGRRRRASATRLHKRDNWESCCFPRRAGHRTTSAICSSNELCALDASRSFCNSRHESRVAVRPLRGGGRQAAASRSAAASASVLSVLRPCFSICRMRSRVTLNVRPTSSSVHGFLPCNPKRSSST
jgi:hypothetical protein